MILKTLYILVELEMRILSDPDFDVKKELFRTKKYYKILTKKYTKNGTKAEQRKAHHALGNEEYFDLYLYKRVLQNYEEYNNIGTISEPIFGRVLAVGEADAGRDVVRPASPIARESRPRRA